MFSTQWVVTSVSEKPAASIFRVKSLFLYFPSFTLLISLYLCTYPLHTLPPMAFIFVPSLLLLKQPSFRAHDSRSFLPICIPVTLTIDIYYYFLILFDFSFSLLPSFFV